MYQTAAPGRVPRPSVRRSPGRLSRGLVPGGLRGSANQHLLVEFEPGVAADVDDDAVAFAELALEHPQRQRIENAALDGALERAGPVHRIVTFGDDELARRFGQLDMDLAILEPLQQAAELNVDDLLHMIEPERVEEDDLVNPVDEFRPEVLAQRLRDLPLHTFVQLP